MKEKIKTEENLKRTFVYNYFDFNNYLFFVVSFNNNLQCEESKLSQISSQETGIFFADRIILVVSGALAWMICSTLLDNETFELATRC